MPPGSKRSGSPEDRPAPAGNIVLVGFMGAGKSEIGRHLARRLGRRLVDTDEMVESDGTSIREIFAAEGEVGFRRREKQAVAKAARSKGAVIATGGGAVLDADNMKRLKRNGVIVYLRVGAAELARRLEGYGDRPLLDDEEGVPDPERRRRRIRRLLKDRTPVYESVADHVVPCDGLDPEAVAGEVMRRIGVGGGGTERQVEVDVRPPYVVHVGRGLLERAARILPIPGGAEKICIVSHPRIRRLWGERLEHGLSNAALGVVWLTFAEGEERKTPDTAARLARKLARAGFHRSDVVIGFGGGVVGDVAGFVASTYARGVPVVQVPTTLLAMVDAAVGGKTGVNLPEGKNLVGTFHQPAAVVADLEMLRTLPERELRGGLAEVAKYAFIADPDLGTLVAGNVAEIFARGEVLEPIVERSVRIKADIVAADEREAGVRAHLNYGHTIGHALEALSLSGKIPRLHHGEAIAVGMVYAAWVSALSGLGGDDLVEEHRRLLETVGLPVAVPGARWEDVRRYTAVDKKYDKGLRLVLLTAPGRPAVHGGVPEEILEEAFRRVTEA